MNLHCLLAAELELKSGSPDSNCHVLAPWPRNIDTANREQCVPISDAIIISPNLISFQLSDVNLSADLAVYQIKLLL